MKAIIVTVLLVAATAALSTPPNVRGTTPEHGTVDLELTPLWTRGGEDDEEVLFGVPRHIIADQQGRVLVLDDQLCQVHVFSPDGEYEGGLGREGDGPGEFRRPSGLIVFPDGDLGVGNMFQARFQVVKPDGTPARTMSLGSDEPHDGALVLYGTSLRGGTLLAATAHSTFDEARGEMDRLQSLDVYNPDGRHRARLCDHRFQMDFTGTRPIRERDVLKSFLMVHAVGPDGLIYVPHERDAYLVDVYDPDGTLVMQISRPDFVAPRRSEREEARIEALADSWARNAGFEFPYDRADTEMTIRNLLVDDRGHLFVRHAASHRDLPEGVFLRLDEFAPDGTWLREVHLRGPGDPMMDTLHWLGDGRVAVLRGGQLIALERWRDAAVYWEGEDEVVAEIVVCRLR